MLVLIVGVWAVIAGVVETAAAFRAGEQAGTQALFILGGLVTVAFGVVLCARPGISPIASLVHYHVAGAGCDLRPYWGGARGGKVGVPEELG